MKSILLLAMASACAAQEGSYMRMVETFPRDLREQMKLSEKYADSVPDFFKNRKTATVQLMQAWAENEGPIEKLQKPLEDYRTAVQKGNQACNQLWDALQKSRVLFAQWVLREKANGRPDYWQSNYFFEWHAKISKVLEEFLRIDGNDSADYYFAEELAGRIYRKKTF